MVADPRQILDSTSAYHNHRVLLEIMAFAGNICGYFLAVSETDSRHLAKSGVRFFRGNRENLNADPPLKGRRGANWPVLDSVEI